MKRAFLFTWGYGALLFLIGAWFTRREYYSTMLAVTLWFMLPMTVSPAFPIPSSLLLPGITPGCSYSVP